MPDIFLVNPRKTPFLFTLYHDYVCRHRRACSCGSLQERNKDGKITIRRLPASCQIDAGCASELLPIEVCHVPQVKVGLGVAPPQLVKITLEDWMLRGLSEKDWSDLKPAERLAMWRRAGSLYPESGEAREQLVKLRAKSTSTSKPKKPMTSSTPSTPTE